MQNPLTVTNEDGVIRIEIGIKMLALSLQMGDPWYPYIFIDDPEKFAKEFINQMDTEDASGVTAVHRFFDQVAEDALEGGCEGWADGDVEQGIELVTDEGDERLPMKFDVL